MIAPPLASTAASYRVALDTAWAAHTAPRAPGAPMVVSLFAGCGGSSLGYSMAGFQERLAVEWNPTQAAVFRANFPDVPLYQGDIASLSADNALSLAELEPGQLDVLDGSPPCQGFSTNGNRVLDDPRNSLFKEYARLLRAFQPKALVMENVSGMVKGKMRLIFVEILGELQDAGYTVRARLLSSARYGVPQDRRRLIFIGVRSDLAIPPSHPPGIPGLPVTAQMALRQMPAHHEPQRRERLNFPYRSETFKHWAKIRPGGKLGEAQKGSNARFGFSNFKQHPGKPANTIVRDDHSWHWAERRQFTVAEYARLGSFPDQFAFPTNWTRGRYAVGNSVPPLFMRCIALHLRTLLEAA